MGYGVLFASQSSSLASNFFFVGRLLQLMAAASCGDSVASRLATLRKL